MIVDPFPPSPHFSVAGNLQAVGGGGLLDGFCATASFPNNSVFLLSPSIMTELTNDWDAQNNSQNGCGAAFFAGWVGLLLFFYL